MSIQKKLIEDILSSYNIINENKNMVFEVTDTYSNIEFRNIGHGNPASDNISTTLLQDIQTAAKSANLNVSVTTAVSGHGKKTKSGNTSRHPSGNAVDIAMINGKAVSLSNRADADKLVAALVSMGYNKNAEGPSNPKAVLTFGFEGHDDHVHVSNMSDSPSQEPTTSSGTTQSSTDSTSSTTSTTTTDTEGGGAKEFAKRVGSTLLGAIGIKESFAKSSFGKNIQTKGGNVLIPRNSNEKIKSPVSGRIVDIPLSSSCMNRIVIEFDGGYLEYCGISNPSVNNGQKIGVGTVLGKTNSNVTVKLYSEKKHKEKIDVASDNNTEKSSSSYGNIFTSKNKKNSPKEKTNTDSKREPKGEYAKLLVRGYRNLKKSLSDKDDEKINENIKRIKGLL